MEVVNETWLEDPDTFYMNVTALKLLDHLTEFFSGINTVNAMEIPQLMKTLFTDADGILQFINATEEAQRKSKQEIVIQDEYTHAVALKSLLKQKQ